MLSRTFLVLLSAVALASTVAVAKQHSTAAHPQGRKLLQAAFCPDGCEDGYCQQAGTPGSLRCAKCKNNLLVDQATGFCACPKGKYTTGEATCVDCPKGSYCVGGIYSLDNPPVNVSCPEFMTTLGRRAASARSCVNAPGYAYNIDAAGNPSATICPLNTYGPGLKKQRACVPCPTGFTTNGTLGRTAATSCLVPAGYYLKGPGQAAPCPMGEWKAGTGADGNCNKCTAGVTTVGEAATSARECKIVTKGYYASSFDTDGSVNGTIICPQGFYCPGGNQTQIVGGRRLAQASLLTSTGIIPCPNGQWTLMPGASTEAECLTPPGHYTNTTLGITARCPEGSYRADWLADAPRCTACGVGVKADRNDRVTQYLTNGTQVEVAITTNPADCYIQPGQGLYFETLTKTWRAKNCSVNSYGVTNTTYGLTPAPCRDCPTGTLASSNATAYSQSAQYFQVNEDGSGGFINEMACVTKPGYGMTGRGAQKCDAGFYNAGNNYDKCKACAFGLTTAGPGVGLTAADCITDKGYGLTNNKMGECPIGYYNDALVKNASIACKACPLGRTTPKAGSDSLSDCQLCLPGYGGLDCSVPCGGVGVNATYGPPGRAQVDNQTTACPSCSANGQTATYSFSYNMQNDLFTPRTVSRIGAASPIECLSEYSQIVDGSFYLPISAAEDPSGNTVFTVPSIADFTACTAECDKVKCQLVTYDYVSKDCILRVPLAPKYEGAPWLALKVLPAGYVGTSPWSIKAATADDGKVRPKALSSGMYAFYQEHLAEAVGIQVLPSAVDSKFDRTTYTSVRDCLNACDDAGDRCSGVTLLSTVEPNDIGKTCMFVTANTEPGVFKRTMIRADLDHLIFPSSFLCPSGYTADGSQTTPCTPMTSPTVVLLFMRATATSCDPSLIESVRTALLNFLQDPNQAFGVYAPGVAVSVGCQEVPSGQRRLLADYVDLYATITYPGTASGGDKLGAACTASGNACTGNTPATVYSYSVQSVALEDVADASVTIEPQTYVAGEPFSFTVTYKLGQAATDAGVVLTTTPGNALSCFSTDAGTGVTSFTCNPLSKQPVVTITASGPNPKTTPPSLVTATTTLYNTTCLKGSIADGDTCTPCAKGSWAAANASSCTNCTDGFTTLRAFSYSADQCNICIPGREGADCTKCPVGKISAGGAASASLACTSCPAGQNTTADGQDACDLCVGGYAGAGCAICPVASWAAGGDKGSENCTSCASGWTTAAAGKTSSDDCNICAAGYGDTDCAICDYGFWSAGGDTNTCTACPGNFTTPTTGSSASSQCTVCKAGFGGPSCSECPVGQYAAGNSTAACTSCPAGKTTSAAGSTSIDDCTVCLPGRGGTNCNQCLKGTYSAGGDAATTTCLDCPTGSTTAADGATASANCSRCTAGYGGVLGVCTQCDIGFYSDTEQPATSPCTACPGNSTTVGAGATAAEICTECLPGFGEASCTICPVGTYSDGASKAACSDCPTGEITALGATSADNCTEYNACNDFPCNATGGAVTCADVASHAVSGGASGRTCACDTANHTYRGDATGCDYDACSTNACNADGSPVTCADIIGGSEDAAGRTCTCDTANHAYDEGTGCAAV